MPRSSGSDWMPSGADCSGIGPSFPGRRRHSLQDQMDGIFSLLETFVHHHPAFYPQVRAELVSLGPP